MPALPPRLSFDADTADRGDVVVDLDRLLASKLLVQANSGGGKSWLLRYLLEQTHGRVAHLVLDPDGEYFTLRERFPYVLVGRGGDVEPDAGAAPALARALAEANASAILDPSDLAAADRDAFAAAFLRALLRLPAGARRPTLLVVDEAQTLAPEGGAQTEAGAALVDVAMRGRKRGLGLVVATQRLSLLSKSIVAQCSNRLIGLTTLGNDQQRAADELGFSKAERAALRKLAPGQFFAFGPAISQEVALVQSGPVETTHPEPGAIVPPAAPASAELAALVEALRSLSTDGASDDVPAGTGYSDRWEAECARLQDELYRVDKANVELQEENARLHELLAQIGALATAAPDTFSKRLARRVELTPRVEAVITAEDGRDDAPTVRATLPPPAPTESIPPSTPAPGAAPANPSAASTMPRAATRAEQGEWPSPSLKRYDDMGEPHRKLLDAVATYSLFGEKRPEKTSVAALAGYRPASGHVNNTFAQLKKWGVIDYVDGGRVELTRDGMIRAQAVKVESVEDVHRAWLGLLNGPQEKVLRALLKVYPRAVSKDDLARMAGLQPGTGHFNNVCGQLRALRAVEYPQKGFAKASALLFPPQLAR